MDEFQEGVINDMIQYFSRGIINAEDATGLIIGVEVIVSGRTYVFNGEKFTQTKGIT